VKTWITAFGAALMASGMPAQAASLLDPICGDCVPELFATCGGFLEGPAVGPDGRIWAVDVVGDRIVEILPDGRCIDVVKAVGNPNGLKVRADGKLVVAAHKGLFLLDSATLRMENLWVEHDGEPITGLNDLALDASGGIYFTAPLGSSILKPTGRVFYRASDGTVTLVADKLAFPNGVAVAADGATILVSEFAAKRILSIPAMGVKGPFAVAHVFAQTDGGVGADGMIVDPEGRLLAANLGARELLVYDRAAALLGTIHLPVTAGDYITNAAIAGGYLYLTEARRGEVWRVKLKHR
jgi:gluconolactonase